MVEILMIQKIGILVLFIVSVKQIVSKNSWKEKETMKGQKVMDTEE
jgi:hypothetical protein